MFHLFDPPVFNKNAGNFSLKPEILGQKYDKIAQWWHGTHQHSNYGMPQLQRAISYCENRRSALDVGCGAGGRIIRKLLEENFSVTGIDVSEKMIEIAKTQHPQAGFKKVDICKLDIDDEYDLIVAWDSIFHLPLNEQQPVVGKLCRALKKDGIMMYSFGDALGDHVSSWHNDKFYYSSIGIDGNMKVIMENGCQCRHLELDQYPEKHVYMIVKKTV